MASHPDYPRTRLYTSQRLLKSESLLLEDEKAHYLATVLRLGEGALIALFNGLDGEWEATIAAITKKTVTLRIGRELRKHTKSADLWLLSAPLKNGKTEWVVEKATELGVARICPVTTQLTVVGKINATRLQKIATEAAEQCERLDVPQIAPIAALTTLLADWPLSRALIYGDESGEGENAISLLPTLTQGSYAVLIGPEGGFSTSELELLKRLPYAHGMCMGPRVMRADTAAIAALTLVQAWCGDWEAKPAFRS